MTSAPYNTTSERLERVDHVVKSAKETASLFVKDGWPAAHSTELHAMVGTPLTDGMLRSRGAVQVASRKSIGTFGNVLPDVFLNLDGTLIVKSQEEYIALVVAGQQDSRLDAISAALDTLKQAG